MFERAAPSSCGEAEFMTIGLAVRSPQIQNTVGKRGSLESKYLLGLPLASEASDGPNLG